MIHENLKKLPAPLLDWYGRERRILPWREEPTPYRVWLSEIMLQQTRVEAALPYFHRFLEALPTVEALAAAPEEQLLKLWEGLGYYSRVRNLQKAAKQVMEQYGGQLPADYEQLRSLPGIGDYTAGAIASIAFGLPEAAVDGNVLRICSRICGDERDMTSQKIKKEYRERLLPLYEGVVAGDLTQALMELGATVCLPNGAPLCEACPARDFCAAYEEGEALKYPFKAPKKPRKIQERKVYILRCGERILLHRRPEKGLLAGLWELPNCLKEESCGLPFDLEGAVAVGRGKHVFSHIEWHMEGYELEVEAAPLPEGYIWATAAELGEVYALPSAFSAFRDRL